MNKEVNKEYDFKNEMLFEEIRKIDRKLSSIFREILTLESRLNAIENRKIQEIKFRSIAEKMKEFNERW